MAAERGRHVMLLGLEVKDDALYTRYRAGMTPILESYGGAFGCDFVVAKVLKGEPGINRVFTLSFPDRASRDRFFADEQYRSVRAALFEPAVARTVILGELEEAA